MPTSPAREPPLVLVFDDDLVVHQDFLGDAARFVYRPHADGAVDDVLAVRPELVLMDFSMGARLDGHGAIVVLRARFPLLPIVAISSDARMNRVMIDAGAWDGVPKVALVENLRHVFGYARPFVDEPDE